MHFNIQFKVACFSLFSNKWRDGSRPPPMHIWNAMSLMINQACALRRQLHSEHSSHFLTVWQKESRLHLSQKYNLRTCILSILWFQAFCHGPSFCLTFHWNLSTFKCGIFNSEFTRRCCNLDLYLCWTPLASPLLLHNVTTWLSNPNTCITTDVSWLLP